MEKERRQPCKVLSVRQSSVQGPALKGAAGGGGKHSQSPKKDAVKTIKLPLDLLIWLYLSAMVCVQIV